MEKREEREERCGVRGQTARAGAERRGWEEGRPLCYLLCIVPVAGAAVPSRALGCRKQIGAAAGAGEHIRGLFC